MNFPIFGASNDDPGLIGATAFQYVCSTHALDWLASEARRQIPLSEDVTITDFKVIIDTAPGAGTSRAYTLRKNGSDTGATVTISDAATSASFSGSVAYAAGDLISLKEVATGSPTAPGNSYWYIGMSTVGKKALLMGFSGNVAPNAADNYVNPFGGSAWTTTSADQDVIVPLAGSLTKANYFAHTTVGVGKSYAVSMRVNNTTDALTGTITGNASQTASATGSQALAAGDTLQIKESPSGTPSTAALAWCFTLVPNNDGESFIGFGNAAAVSTSATQFTQPLGVGNAGWATAEANHLLKIGAVTLKSLYARLSAAPGIGSSRAFTLRDNASSSALTVTISGANTTGNDTTHTVTHTADQSIGMQAAISIAPAAANLHLGIVLVTLQAKSGSGTITAASSVTGTQQTTRSGTVSLTAASAVTGTLTTNHRGTSTLTASSAVTATGTGTRSGTGVVAVTTAITSAATTTRSGSGSSSAATALTGTGEKQQTTTSAISASTAISASGTAERSGTSTVAASATATAATGTANRTGEGVIGATPIVTGDGAPIVIGQGVISAVSAVTATGSTHRAGNSTIVIVPAASASGQSNRSGSSTLNTTTNVTGTGLQHVLGSLHPKSLVGSVASPALAGSTASALSGAIGSITLSGTVED